MNYAFPDHQINPADKNADWIMKFLKAAWSEGRSVYKNCLYNGKDFYDNLDLYALGRQSPAKYQKELLGEETTDQSWAAINWAIPAIIPKYREIAISKLMQRLYDVQAKPVDPLSKSKEDEYFNQMRVKLVMQDIARKHQSDLADNPALKPAPNEPQDIDQLLAQAQFGFKSNMSREAELAIDLTLQRNSIEVERYKVCASMFDYGAGGYTDYIDHTGKECFRAVNIKKLLVSPCEHPDFRDMVYWGEPIEVPVVDLVPYFSATEIAAICNKLKGKYNNPTTIDFNSANYYTSFKALVFDCQFLSWDTKAIKRGKDWRGNLKVSDTDYSDLLSYNDGEESRGEDEPKYLGQSRKVCYHGKWIVDTDFIYDYGLCLNQKRKRSSWWDTSLDLYLFAWNFKDMQFAGILERLIPAADNYATTWYKLQNLTNKLIPYLINLDIAALENTNFSMGGKKFDTPDLIQLIADNFIAIYRSTDLLEKNPNYKPVSIEASAMMFAFKDLYDRLEYLKQMIRDLSGLNELTDGSSPSDRMLSPVAKMAYESTNNALFLASNAERNVFKRLCDAIVQKVQIAVKLGKVDGYVRALGMDSLEYFEVSDTIAMSEFGIFIDDAPNDQERQEFIAKLNIKDSQGLIDPTDDIIVRSCRNLKQASGLLAYNIKKRTEEMRQFELQKITQTTQQQTQSAKLAAEMAESAEQMKHQFKMEELNLQYEWQYKMAQLKVQGNTGNAAIQGHAKVLSTQIQADVKRQPTGAAE